MHGVENIQRPAVFLDRDGTIIEDCGIVRTPQDVRFLEDAIPALRLLNDFFDLFIVTHQPHIAAGCLTMAELDAVHAAIIGELARQGVYVRTVYTCPHARGADCACIKPKPFFLEQAARDYGIDLAASFSVGDHPHDVALVEQAGGQGVYILTGHGRKHRGELPPGVVVMPDLAAAARWICAAYLSGWRRASVCRKTEEAAACLRNGGLVVFPTETVYGLGALAGDARAVAQIFEVKARPKFDPLIVHIADPEQLDEIAASVPAAARRLADEFWPGPLTLVLPKRANVPDLVTAGLPTVAVRMPCHPIALHLIRMAGAPVAAPSANRFGGISPTTAAAARAELGDQVPIILDGGPCVVGVESTVLSLLESPPCILRQGGIAAERLAKVLGGLASGAPPTPISGGRLSPGQFPRHYAPRTPLSLWHGGALPPDAMDAVLLLPLPAAVPKGFRAVKVLAPDGDLRAAAAALFATLRDLDGAGYARIYAGLAPERGLGRAINERLRRAASDFTCATI